MDDFTLQKTSLSPRADSRVYDLRSFPSSAQGDVKGHHHSETDECTYRGNIGLTGLL